MDNHPRVIFLDVDGVLNSMNYADAVGEHHVQQMNPASVLCLLRIHLVSGCKFVMSSDWRLSEEYPNDFLYYLHKAGWPSDISFPLIGKTPYFHPIKGSYGGKERVRDKEIQAWLRENMPDALPWEHYLVLDDDHTFSEDIPLVPIDMVDGLTAVNMAFIIKHWNIPSAELMKTTFSVNTQVSLMPVLSELKRKS